MKDELVLSRILTRIDNFDEKFDQTIDNLRKDVTDCKIDVQAVQKDLTNHLNNKKDESENFKRRVYITTAIMGVMFTAYATIKELF